MAKKKKEAVFPEELTVVLEEGGTHNEWLNARRNGLDEADIKHGTPVAIYRRVSVGYAEVIPPTFKSDEVK